MASQGQRVSWGDESTKRRGRSNSRGRKNNDIPLSFFNPITLKPGSKFWDLCPRDFVPLKIGNKDQQIGYWNRQIRYRMAKGQRKDLPERWFFYYLGTGPHADAKYKQKLDGVVWVAKEGAMTKPTTLGTRGPNNESKALKFDVKVPSEFQLEVNQSRDNSRLRSQSRSQSRNRSQSRGRQQSNNRKDDSVEQAVLSALKKLGVDTEKQQRSRSKSKERSSSKTRDTTPKNGNKHTWKRTAGKGDVTKFYGSRSSSANFGDSDLVANGNSAKHYPQLAECVPSVSSILFGSHWTAKEDGDQIEVTFTHKYHLPKDDPKTGQFLEQINAYTRPSEVAKEQRQRKSRSKSAEKKQDELPEPLVENYTDVFDDTQVEIIDEVTN
ncbi:nucleocapsid protein [Alphacoronavirus 1]|uniref:Nucleoprotein n=2 Tax=Alphacoronavirus 1 TaxID=693997 RepID=A0A0K2BMC9_9ALPC|nr:nucleoprotein [Canine coronavirus]AKZ66475.1 nucleocapsid protein [Alphacoronavirus 1]